MQKSMQAGKRHTNLRIRPRLSVGQIVLIVVLTLLAILMMTPFIWSVIASLTSRFDLEGQGFKFFYGHFGLLYLKITGVSISLIRSL